MPAPTDGEAFDRQAARLADTTRLAVIWHGRDMGPALGRLLESFFRISGVFHSDLTVLAHQPALNARLVAALASSTAVLPSSDTPAPGSSRVRRGARAQSLRAAADRQLAWNRAANRVVELANGELPVGWGEAHQSLAGLRQAVPVPDGPGLAPPDRWLLRRQAQFAQAFDRAARARLGVLRSPPDREATDIRLEREEAARIAAVAPMLEELVERPLVSILTPTFDTPTDFLEACLDSVVGQLYGNWELCVVDDGSTAPNVRPVLERYAARDPRISLSFLPTNQGITAATNAALGQARGEWVCFLDHDDVLAPHALAELVLRTATEPGLDVIYTDNDRLGPDGRRASVHRKPDWSPDLLQATMFVQHLLFVRRELAVALGGFRTGLDAAQDYDLTLRLAGETDRIGHIPQVLYHWRESPLSLATSVDRKPHAPASGLRAVSDHFRRSGIDVEVRYCRPTHFRAVYRMDPLASASIIVVPPHHPLALETLLDSITRTCAGLAYEVIPATDGINRAVSSSSGETVVLVHDDVEATESGWLEELVSQAHRPEIGVVGGRLTYPDGTIQSAGIVIGLDGMFASPFAHFEDGNVWTLAGSVAWPRNYLAVSGAAMALRRKLFDALGGTRDSLAVGWDVDLCLRTIAAGYRVLYSPHASLVHHHVRREQDEEERARQGWRHTPLATVLSPWIERGDPFFPSTAWEDGMA